MKTIAKALVIALVAVFGVMGAANAQQPEPLDDEGIDNPIWEGD